LLLKHIAVEALLTVRNFVPADACADHLNPEIRICLLASLARSR
jgi:hypothetical protein